MAHCAFSSLLSFVFIVILIVIMIISIMEFPALYFDLNSVVAICCCCGGRMPLPVGHYSGCHDIGNSFFGVLFHIHTIVVIVVKVVIVVLKILADMT